MKYIKKDFDKSLVVLILFFLVLFILFTAYYEITLRNVLTKKSQSDEKLGKITAQLVLEKLNDTEEMNKMKLIDKALLNNKYNDLAARYEDMRKENLRLEDELTLLKSQLEYHQARIEGPVAQFRLIQEKNQQIKELSEKIDVLCAMLKSANASVEECG